ncbi:MAG: M48 family metalloprotease [Desulfobulbaceae bacterium]|nr:M48 family metalloprotease [Desulfobulbaceae bacterium]
MLKNRIIICLLLFLAACAVNPVTGNRELALVGQQQEIAIGSKQYEPGRQMQGGDYISDPELSAYVNSVGQKLAAVSDRPLPYEFKILNNSTPNAWALPGGKLVVNRGLLLELGSEAELAAVLSHEIVHAAARHGAKSMERGMLLQGALLATSLAVSNSDYAGLAVGGAQLTAGLITQKYSRNAELEADYYGMQYMKKAGYDPQSAVALQETFVRLSEGKRSNWLAGLFASHPPSPERVEANRKTALTLGGNGFTGARIYQQKISHLKRVAPAYKAFDEAQKALQQKDTGKALALADQALKIEPNEALFYGLKGDIFFGQNKYNEALQNYDRAIYLNDHFFNFYLQRGLTREKLGDRQGAGEDLKRSTNLLPTATAYKNLGDFSLAAGNRTEAKTLFQTAAASESPDGEAALLSFIRLDLADNPGKYLVIRASRETKNGWTALSLTNSSPFAIRDVNFQVRYVTAAGKVTQAPFHISATISPGKSILIPLEGQPLPTDSLNTMETHFSSVQIVR